MKQIRVGVLFGGRSGEHAVSLLSAASVIEGLNKNKKYEVVPIAINKEGQWICPGDARALLQSSPKSESHNRGEVPCNHSDRLSHSLGKKAFIGRTPDSNFHSSVLVPLVTRNSLQIGNQSIKVDIIFPVIHGTFGEDGTIQGLLELADIPYVGGGVLGSAAGMDKDIMKRLFREAGLPIVKHVTVYRNEWRTNPRHYRNRIEKVLRYPVFVKPANLGSSVGISKAHMRKELDASIEEAAQFDRKIIVEESVGGSRAKARELECSVLGNDKPIASLPGEVVPERDFYDYYAKYHDGKSKLHIPAPLPQVLQKKIMKLAVRAFLAVEGCGLGRIDFLMDPITKEIFINEINTMPGFTSISMYPKLWAASGIPYLKLLDRLIALGFERHQEKKNNKYGQ